MAVDRTIESIQQCRSPSKAAAEDSQAAVVGGVFKMAGVSGIGTFFVLSKE